MPRYKISDRLSPYISYLSDMCRGVAFPFHLFFPARFATDEQFAADLTKRLRAIPYPYELARAKRTQSDSTYDVLRKRGALESLFQASVIHVLHLQVETDEQWFGLRHLRFANTEAGKKFRKFHIPLAKDLARHVSVLRRLSESYDLAEEWIGPYVRTVEERLMLEIVLLRECTEEKYESDASATRNSVKTVYSTVSDAFKMHASHALCRHVTSIIFSPDCVTTKVLLPNPESVRKLLSRNPVKK